LHQQPEKEIPHMAKRPLWMIGWGVLAWIASTPVLRAESPPAKEIVARATPAPVVATAADREIEVLAAKIDAYFAKRWEAAKVEAAPPAGDAEFMRRVYLDIVGRIPRVREARDFLDDKSPDKRRRLVDRLLNHPNYARHFADVFRALWMSEANTSFTGRFLIPGFETWLRERLRKNTPYDQMVREILTTPVDPRQGFFFGDTGENVAAFVQSKEYKPENLAGSTARLFLGVRLECAQCHDHPFATWKREQFWGLAAFYAGIRSQAQGDFVQALPELNDRREIAIPGSERVVQAGFLDGSEPQWKFKVNPRVTLADWVTSPDNPYFARAAVNRMWAELFGMGLIDPVDDMMGSETQAHHPELLDDLAKQFAAHKFDLKFLIRVLTASQVYQLTSAATHKSQVEPFHFAKMTMKGLTPEQLFDSLAEAVGFQEAQLNPIFFGQNNVRSAFLEKFANRSEKASEAQTSILQAMTLMNGKFIGDATSGDASRSEMLAGVLDIPWMGTSAKIETMYLATLSRKPRPEELSRLLAYVDRSEKEILVGKALDAVQNVAAKKGAKDQTKSKNEALADVLWALLNSSEFFLNH
jgi:hypothetical protein